MTDAVLADRVRSSLGTLGKRLDLPRVHVMAEDHVVLLHGEVASSSDAEELVAAVSRISGVAGVESYLHVGLIRSDTRPSEGKVASQESQARRRLVDAAVAAGAHPAMAAPVVRAVLATFAERLPAGERDDVAAHLPDDVRSMFTPPRRARSTPPPRTIRDLLARITAGASPLADTRSPR